MVEITCTHCGKPTQITAYDVSEKSGYCDACGKKFMLNIDDLFDIVSNLMHDIEEMKGREA